MPLLSAVRVAGKLILSVLWAIMVIVLWPGGANKRSLGRFRNTSQGRLPIMLSQMQELPMPNQSKVIAFDLDQASLSSLRKALPDSVIEVVNGATAASLTRDWNPGTVDLLVVKARREVAETLELCRFLVSCGVLARDAPVVTDSQEEIPKTLGLHRRRRKVGRRSHSPLLVLVLPSQRSIVRDVLKAGAHSCILLPINAKDVANMLVHAQVGNQPGRHTLNLERAQTEDRWRDDGGEG